MDMFKALERGGWFNEDENGCVTAFGGPDNWATVIGNIHYNPDIMKGGGE